MFSCCCTGASSACHDHKSGVWAPATAAAHSGAAHAVPARPGRARICTQQLLPAGVYSRELKTSAEEPRVARQLADLVRRRQIGMYGYDRDTLRRRPTTRRATTVIRFDDAQRHDARRRHARHPPHPDDNTRPNVRRKRRLRAQLPKPVYLFQRPQTCNRCETNPSR